MRGSYGVNKFRQCATWKLNLTVLIGILLIGKNRIYGGLGYTENNR